MEDEENMKRKILVLGNFGYTMDQLDGQTIKTRNVYALIKSKLDADVIKYVDTQKIQHKKSYLFYILLAILSTDLLIYLPGERNLRILFPLINVVSKVKHLEILHIVVGGWLNNFLLDKKNYVKRLKQAKGTFVESAALKNQLEENFDFTNVEVIPNFRIHSFAPSFRRTEGNLKLVFLSRITKPKGIDVIFQLADFIKNNSEKFYIPVRIDFYGQIAKEDKIYFEQSLAGYDFVSYGGVIEPENVYPTLNEYDVLLLPTRYSGEGFPGIILDAYIAGIPVVTSNWRFIPEFVDSGITGYIYDVNNNDDFFEIISNLTKDLDGILTMKENAYRKSFCYSSDKAYEILNKYL